jgi:hypothetical protein
VLARAALGLVLTALAGAALGAPRSTGSADPGVGWRLPAADASALVVSDRLDARGSNQSKTLLPVAPELRSQARVVPPIVGQPMVSSGGRLLVAHGVDRLSAIDAEGRTAWSVRLGTELASGPLLVAGGHTLLLARDGRLFEVSPAGSVRERGSLPWSAVEGTALGIPTADGGALFATGARLARVGSGGTRGFHARIADPIRALFEWRGRSLALGHDGSIWTRGTSGEPEEAGSFGQPVQKAALAGDRLLALTDHELCAFDLTTGRKKILWSDPALDLHDLALVGAERVRLVGGKSALIELAADGRELSRLALPVGEVGSELGSVLTDARGQALVRGTGSPLWSVTPQGDVAAAPGTACPDALRPAPIADGRVVLACRSGLLRVVSDRAR